MRNHPSSTYLEQATEIAAEAKKRLAKHELYVAEFYANRKKWPAVVGRLKRVTEEFSGLGFDEQAFFGLYDAYLRLGDSAKAHEALRSVIQKLPGTPAAAKAQKLLGNG